MILYNVKNNLGIQNLKNLQNDIANIRDKVSEYYSTNIGNTSNVLPTIGEYTNDEKLEELNDAGIISEAVDKQHGEQYGSYYVIDLSALDNLTLTYGKDFEKIKNGEVTDVNELEDIFIINTLSHNIFYVKGVKVDGITYYTDYTSEEVDQAPIPYPVPNSTEED